MLHIGGENIDCVNNFNIVGIVVNHHLNCHSHTTNIVNKICKIIGILNKLRHILPQHILPTIYTSLINYYLLNALSRRRREVNHVSFDCAIPHVIIKFVA